MNKFTIIKSFLILTFFYLSFLFITLISWIRNVFGKVDFIQILFFLQTNIEGTSELIIKSLKEDVFLLCIYFLIFIIILLFLLCFISKNKKYKKYLL